MTNPIDAEIESARELNTWFILREPERVPELKGPFPPGQVKSFLIELMEARPSAFITVLTLHESGPSVEDGPQCLEILDRRHRARAKRHRASTAAAFSSPAPRSSRSIR